MLMRNFVVGLFVVVVLCKVIGFNVFGGRVVRMLFVVGLVCGLWFMNLFGLVVGVLLNVLVILLGGVKVRLFFGWSWLVIVV